MVMEASLMPPAGGTPAAIPSTFTNLDRLSELLESNSWTCFPSNKGTARVFVRTGIRGRNGTYRIVLHVAKQVVKAYALCDVRVPESKKTRVEDLCRQLNRSTRLGAFELNMMNGNLRYKASIKDRVISLIMIQKLVAASLLTIDHHYPCVLGICNGLMTSTKAVREDSLAFNV